MQGGVMERNRLEKEPEAETPLPHVRRETSIPAWTSPPAKGQHAREGISDPSAGRDGKSSSWTGAGLAMNLPGRMPDVLKRYSLALVLAGLALLLRGTLPVLHGTAIYQLPIAAVVLSAWYGGRGPGLLASLICATGILYLFIPPAIFVRTVTGLCARFLHLHRVITVPQRVRCGAPACRAHAAGGRGALSHLLGRCGRRAHGPCRGWNSRRREPASV